MPADLTRAIRLKATIDAALKAAPDDPIAASPALVAAYGRAWFVVRDFAAGTEVEREFDQLFPHPNIGELFGGGAMQARSLLIQMSGWLGSWPSVDRLLDELIGALEEAAAHEPEETDRNWLRGAVENLRGPGREIGVRVISVWLEHVLGHSVG